MTRTLTSSKGKKVTTHLTDGQAFQICGSLPSGFAQSLVSKGGKWGLTPDQWVWVHALALESLTKDAEIEAETHPTYPAIPALFQTAQAHLENPKIRLETASGGTVVLTVASGKSKYPGHIHVSDGGPYGNNRYYGRIEPQGVFHAGRELPEGVSLLLSLFAENPVAVAAAYGLKTGRCSFCGRDLSDPRSTTVGYGPICAGHYGLPWGEVIETGLDLSGCVPDPEARSYWQGVGIGAGTNLG